MPTDLNDPPPLDYRAPGGDGADTAWLTLAFIGGLIASGAAAVLVTWTGAALILGGLHDGDAALWLVTAGFFVGSVVAIVLFVRRIRGGRQMTTESRRRRGRFLMLGFLLGLGVIWLLQGICFAALSRMD